MMVCPKLSTYEKKEKNRKVLQFLFRTEANVMKYVQRKSPAERKETALPVAVSKCFGKGSWKLFHHLFKLVFAHAATYVTSASVLPVHQVCKAPVVILNLQPTARINYARTTTGEWLAHCGACPVPEVVNALHRAGIGCEVINGLLGLPETVLLDNGTLH